MKLVLHIVAKDLRKLQWPLLGWLLIVAAQLAIGFALVGGVELPRISANQLEAAVNGLRGASYLLTFVLTAMLVQEDLIVGSTQFWVTRPISNRRLLAAKAAGWLLLLCLPQVLLTLPWWIVCGFGGREIALAALEIAVIQAAVALPAALVASLTDTLSRFLVWAFVFLFSAVIIPGTLKFWIPNKFTEQDIPAMLLWIWVVFAVAVATVTARQYLRRQTVGSLVWLGVSAAVAPAVAGLVGLWLVPALQTRRTWTDWRAERVAGASVELQGWRAAPEDKKKRRGEVYINTLLAVRGLPPELVLDSGWEDKTRQTWRWPGGLVVTRESDWIYSWSRGQNALRTVLAVAAPQRDEETERYQAKEAEARLAKNPGLENWQRQSELFHRETPEGVQVTAWVLPSTIDRMRQTPPAYEAEVRLRAMRPELWLEKPPGASGWQARHGFGWRIERPDFRLPGVFIAEPEGTNPTRLQMVVTAPELAWDMLTARQNHWSDWGTPTTIIMFNRKGGDLDWHRSMDGPLFHIGSVAVRLTRQTVWQPMVRRGDDWVPRDPNWYADTRVALVGFREEARFTRELKLERFEPAK